MPRHRLKVMGWTHMGVLLGQEGGILNLTKSTLDQPSMEVRLKTPLFYFGFRFCVPV